MKKWITVFVLLLFCSVVLFAPTQAEAKPHQLTWTWPTTDCDAELLMQADLLESELIYSASPMPMPSDTAGPCDATADPGAPAGALLVPIPVADTSVILNLQPGQTYYARIRVSAYVNGNWSSWSTELQFTVPYGRPNKTILSDGWLQYEYQEITTTAFGRS